MNQPPEPSALETVIDIVVAVGTVGALIAAIVTIAVQRNRAVLEGVSGVRSWLSWRHKNVEHDSTDEAHPEDRIQMWAPGADYGSVLNVENTSQAFIYDVLVALWPSRSGIATFSAQGHSLRPGQSIHHVFPGNFELLQKLFVTGGRAFGAEVTFRDASGNLWNRTANGRLRRLKPLKWFRPWHVPHPLEDVQKFPWYAWRAKWSYRWIQHSRQARIAPVWWAVDLRWERWRYARTHHPVNISIWKIRKRWRARHEIADDRRRNGLPIPYWIVDAYWKNVLLTRRYRLQQRGRDRQQAREERELLRVQRSTWRRVNPHDQ